MDIKATGKCIIKQGSGLVTTDKSLSTKSFLLCRMTPFIITEDADIDNFTGGKVYAIHQVDDQFFNFFEEEVKELQAGKGQSIITSIF